jgi:hypothetical protein
MTENNEWKRTCPHCSWVNNFYLEKCERCGKLIDLSKLVKVQEAAAALNSLENGSRPNANSGAIYTHLLGINDDELERDSEVLIKNPHDREAMNRIRRKLLRLI